MSEQEREHIEDLVGKYILGEASQQERLEVENWCAQNPDNQKYLEDTQWIYDQAQLPTGQMFDADKAWGAVLGKIEAPKHSTASGFAFWRIAASIALIAGLSYVFYLNFAPGEEFVFVSENQVTSQVLPDQTEISLNRASEVKVDYNPRKKTGTIQLKGEATISIGKEKDIHWTVEAENLLIRDIGTVFHVRAYPESQQIEVSVLEGAVQFYSASEAGIMLQAGEKGVYNKSTQQYSRVEADTNIIAYKTRSFQFTEESLDKVVALIGEVYARKISLSGPIGACKITVGFENEDFDTILGILSETMGLEIHQNGEEIVLEGEGCF